MKHGLLIMLLALFLSACQTAPTQGDPRDPDRYRKPVPTYPTP